MIPLMKIWAWEILNPEFASDEDTGDEMTEDSGQMAEDNEQLAANNFKKQGYGGKWQGAKNRGQ